MPETYTNFNPSGVPDGHGTGVASIIGPGVTQVGGDIYIANSDGTFGNQISGSGGGQLPTYTDDTVGGISITETHAGSPIVLTATGAGGSIDLVAPATGGISIQSGGGGGVIIGTTGDLLAFFGASAVVQQSITGALSTVADAPAKAVLTSIIASLVAFGLDVDSTT